MNDEQFKTIVDKIVGLELAVAALTQRVNEMEKTNHLRAPSTPPFFPWTPGTLKPYDASRCPKCGITLDKVMSYSCPHSDCPTGLGPAMC